jgi:hypothetical protein
MLEVPIRTGYSGSHRISRDGKRVLVIDPFQRCVGCSFGAANMIRITGCQRRRICIPSPHQTKTADVHSANTRQSLEAIFKKPLRPEITISDYTLQSSGTCGLKFANPMMPGSSAFYDSSPLHKSGIPGVISV